MPLIAEDQVADEAVARAIRAQVEYENFLFIVERDGSVSCTDFASGKEYRIAHGACSCPDFIYRCAEAGIRCKHVCAMELAQAKGEVN